MKRTILHVEDDYFKAGSLRDCLEDYECDVTIEHVTTVQDGLAKLATGSYACVVSDWNLGDGDGHAIVKECQRLGFPVCVMSGSFRLMEDVKWITSDRIGEVALFVRRHVAVPPEEPSAPQPALSPQQKALLQKIRADFMPPVDTAAVERAIADLGPKSRG